MGASRDLKLIYAAAFLRATAVSMVSVLLAVYLKARGLEPRQMGIVVALGLAGMAVGTLGATLWGDRHGRRRWLALVAIASAAGAVAMAFGPTTIVIGACAFLGMVNGMGRDRSASLVLEQAALPGISGDDRRTRVFAWYNVLQDTGGALGGLLGGLPDLLGTQGLGPLPASQGSIGVYAILMLACAALYRGLGEAVEPVAEHRNARLSPASRRVVTKLAALSAMDSFGGGFLTNTLLTYWFLDRFGVGASTVGILFAVSRLANAGSHLAAAWLATRIGLVNTMVFTHIPSSLLLMTVPFAPSFPVAVVLFVIREGLVEMDVPTRQSYTMAVVRPEERTLASGITTICRVAAWAAAPAFAGLLMESAPATPLYVGSAIKIVYDLLLWREFRHLRPPEELASSTGA